MKRFAILCMLILSGSMAWPATLEISERRVAKVMIGWERTISGGCATTRTVLFRPPGQATNPPVITTATIAVSVTTGSFVLTARGGYQIDMEWVNAADDTETASLSLRVFDWSDTPVHGTFRHFVEAMSYTSFRSSCLPAAPTGAAQTVAYRIARKFVGYGAATSGEIFARSFLIILNGSPELTDTQKANEMKRLAQEAKAFLVARKEARAAQATAEANAHDTLDEDGMDK